MVQGLTVIAKVICQESHWHGCSIKNLLFTYGGTPVKEAANEQTYEQGGRDHQLVPCGNIQSRYVIEVLDQIEVNCMTLKDRMQYL